MNISRKDFIKKSLFSLGEAIGSVAGALKSSAGSETVVTEEHEEKEFEPVERDDRVAVANKDQCLGKECGCFLCEESCKAEAITVVLGEGVRIDEEMCSGCGACEYVCPMTPKGVTMEQRSSQQIESAEDADNIRKKGE